MKIVYNDIGTKNYICEARVKKQIYLHHTVSSTATSTIDWFKQLKYKVSTAFVVDKDGTIYQLFDPNYWAWHLGNYASEYDNAQSIGIEIVNEGALSTNTGTLKWEYGNYNNEPFTLDKPWRGYTMFAPYTTKQVEAVAGLIRYLCNKFSIRREVINNFDFNKNLLGSYSGVLFHCNVHDGKTDISPAFPIEKLRKKIKLIYIPVLSEILSRARECTIKDKLYYA